MDLADIEYNFMIDVRVVVRNQIPEPGELVPFNISFSCIVDGLFHLLQKPFT